MLYEVSGVAQLNNQQQKINILIDGEDENQVREGLKSFGIAVLSLKSYSGTKEDFGKIEFSFSTQKGVLNGVVPFNKIKDAYDFLHKLGISVSYINNLSSPLEQEKVDLVLNKLKKDYSEQDEKQKQKDQEQKKKEDGAIISEKKLKEFRGLIDETLNEAQTLIDKVKGVATPTLIRPLEEKLGELKKMRMGSNVDRMSELFESILSYMEKLELDYANNLKDEEYNNTKDSVISDLDIVIEYDKYKKSQKVYKGSTVGEITKSFDDYYYGSMGKVGVYLKLLFKELKLKSEKLQSFYPKLVEAVELLFMVLILELSLYYIFNIFSGAENSDLLSVFYYLWNFGLLGFLVYFFRFFKKESFSYLLTTVVGVLILYWIGRSFIIANFGL